MEKLDKLIEVPAATPKGTVLLTAEEMRQFNQDYETVRDVAGSMANIALCLLTMLDEDGDDKVKVPRELIERVKGSQIVFAEDALGNIDVKITRRAPSLIALDGRND